MKKRPGQGRYDFLQIAPPAQGWPPSHLRIGHAQVAQLVEHAIENRSVGGSIPSLGTISLKSSGKDVSVADIGATSYKPCAD